MEVTKNGIAQKLKQRQPGNQQQEKETLVRQAPPAINSIRPPVVWRFTYGSTVRLHVFQGGDNKGSGPAQIKF